MRYLVCLTLMLTACAEEKKPEPQIVYVQQPPPAPAPPQPPGAPAAGAPVGPVAPGQYVNHVGNPAAGQWGPDGQWQWKDPESKEANSTMSYIAAAGLGAAGGAALSYLFTKNHFEKQNPGGQWSQSANMQSVDSYRDKRGNPISQQEYERRREQSERDRKAHVERQKAKLAQDRQRFEREKAEYERRKAQSERDRKAHQARQEANKPKPAPKQLRESGGSYAKQQQAQPSRWKPPAGSKPTKKVSWGKKRRRR